MPNVGNKRDSVTLTPIPGDELADLGEPIKVSGGREVDDKAKKLADKHRLPKVPGRYCKFPELIEWVKLLGDEMWEHVDIYVYRTFPQIDKQINDPKAAKYIDIIGSGVGSTGMMSEEYMIDNHGGGRYKFLVNDRDKDHTISEASLDISIAEHDPVLNLDELDLDAKVNRTYIKKLKAKGVLNSLGEPVKKENEGSGANNELVSKLIDRVIAQNDRLTDGQRQAVNQGVEDPATKMMLDMVQQGHKQALDMISKSNTEGGPTAQIEMITALVTLLEKMQGANKPADNNSSAFYESMMKMQAEHHKTVLELVREKNSNSGGGGLLDDMEKLGRVKELFGDIFQGGGSGKRPWYEPALEHGGPVLMKGLETLGKYLDLSKMFGGTAPASTITPQPTMRQQPQQARIENRVVPISATPGSANDRIRQQIEEHERVSQHPQSQPMQETMEPTTATATELKAANPTSEMEMPNLAAQAAQLFAQHGPIILQHMGVDNAHGAYFAENIVNMFGKVSYNQIKQFGKENIIEGMKMVPDFWQNAVTVLDGTEQGVDNWVDEFLGYPESMPDDDEDDDDVPDPNDIPTIKVKGGRA